MSDTPPTLHEETAQRTTALEIKLSYLELQLDQLDAVVIAQQAQIHSLQSLIQGMQYQQRQSESNGFISLRHELPPHY